MIVQCTVIENSSMSSGKFYWMTSSCKHMSRASWFIVVTVSCVDSILGSSHTPQIIPKSMYYSQGKLACAYSGLNRVLIATVRNLGGCPCPCCLIPKDHIHNMGRPRDRMQCETLARNDVTRHSLVSEARKLIYEKDLGVGSTRVEQILKPQSWVPTSVSLQVLC